MLLEAIKVFLSHSPNNTHSTDMHVMQQLISSQLGSAEPSCPHVQVEQAESDEDGKDGLTSSSTGPEPYIARQLVAISSLVALGVWVCPLVASEGQV